MSLSMGGGMGGMGGLTAGSGMEDWMMPANFGPDVGGALSSLLGNLINKDKPLYPSQEAAEQAGALPPEKPKEPGLAGLLSGMNFDSLGKAAPMLGLLNQQKPQQRVPLPVAQMMGQMMGQQGGMQQGGGMPMQRRSLAEMLRGGM